MIRVILRNSALSDWEVMDRWLLSNNAWSRWEWCNGKPVAVHVPEDVALLLKLTFKI